MSGGSFTFPAQEKPDALLTRLQENYTRQKRLVAAQKRKQADVALQAAAAYYGDLPITLELLSDQTASLFTELERLIEAKQDSASTVSRETSLLHSIRAAVNRELRQSMSFIEEGYQSGFETLMRQSRLSDGRKETSPTEATASASRPQPSHAATDAASSCDQSNVKAQAQVRDTLSAHLSLVAESLAVLLQCETVRIYLYDEHANLWCAAQFPYHAHRADPMRSSPLALMTVREVHQTVCCDCLAVNGTVSSDGTTATPPPSSVGGRGSNASSGVEDIRTCLLFPLLASSGAGKSCGMIHAVNKHLPGVVDANEMGSTKLPLRGFSLEDEVLVANAARLLATTLSRYPAEAFTNASIGEAIRRRAHPGDAQVGSLSAHLAPALHDDIEEAAEVGQGALNRTLPTLVYRAPVNAIFASRGAAQSRQRRVCLPSVDHDASVSTVAFRLRCMNELWASSRNDNTALHQQYRALEEETQQTRMLLRNVLDGVATARSMHVSEEVAQYLQTLEVYGRSERTERLAAFVADKMLTLSQNKDEAERMAVTILHTSGEGTALSAGPAHGYALSAAELQRLQHDHARLNTVTVSSLHYDGPDGVPSYTSDPTQKREQVRFIDELQRISDGGAGAMSQPVSSAATSVRRSGKRGGGGASHSSSPVASLPRLATSCARVPQNHTYPFQRPFKL